MIAPPSPKQSNGQPQQGSVTARQNFGPFVGGYGVAGTGEWAGAPGGSTCNPLAFPGWNGAGGNYATGLGYGYWVYRWMLKHPMIQSVRGKVFNRAIASKWSIDAPNANVQKWFDTWILKHREHYMAEALRCLDYGHACFEPVWGQDDEGMFFVRFKPLWVDWTTICEDYSGEFTGFQAALRSDLSDDQREAIQQMVADEAQAKEAMQPNLVAAAYKAMLVTFDGEGGNHYGRPPLENIKETAWKPWLLCAQQIAKLGGKLSERQAYALVPPGSYPTDSGPRTFKQDAIDALKAHARGESVVLVKLMPNLEMTDAQTVASYAGKSFVEFDTIDYGSNSSAIEYLTKLMGYYDGLFFHGYQQSPRAGMESKTGSKADSEQHTETDTLFVERVARLMTTPVQPYVDEMARLNFGLKPGAVVLKQQDISDPTLGRKQAMLEAGITSTVAGQEVAGVIDWTANAKDCGITTRAYVPPPTPPEPDPKMVEAEVQKRMAEKGGTASVDNPADTKPDPNATAEEKTK